jgi:SHS2 domain-containing protein
MTLAPSHTFLEHTGEMHLRIRARSFPELLAEAGRALTGLLLRGARSDAVGSWATIEVRWTDPAALLVDWLNELIYRAESGLEAPTEFDVQEAGLLGSRGGVGSEAGSRDVHGQG